MIGEAIDLVVKAKEEGWLNRLLDNFRRKHRILIAGETGAGKTQLCRSLTEAHADAIVAADRTSFPVTTRVRISEQLFDFTDLPGQRMHSRRRQPVFQKGLAGGLGGIINVVSYGYHEYEAARSDAIGQDGTISQTYLENRRLAELAALDEWVPLRASASVPWIITVVTKADLWWHDWPAIRAYYEIGPYRDRLEAGGAVVHTVLPYASVVHKFYGKIPVSGHFDDEDRHKRRAALFRVLLEAIGKGHLPVEPEA